MAAMRAFHLWIDGVGGYLVCLENRVTLGQATGEEPVDVPILADVSRLHAAVVRDSEGYLLEALRPAQVNGKAVERTLLRDKDRVTLGDSCELLFRQPVPVSASARLDLVSGQRFRLAVDGVLLMADTLVLSASEQAHVQMADLKQSVILYRTKTGLGIRAAGTLVVDGQTMNGRALLGPYVRVEGEEFTLAVEAIPVAQTARL
jgi:hypothetical protein